MSEAVHELCVELLGVDPPRLLLDAVAGLPDDDRRPFLQAVTGEQIRRLRAVATPAGRLALLIEDVVNEELAGLFRERVRRIASEEL